MPTITGLTADRMQEIIDGVIVDADVVGTHLILTKEDGSTIDAGVVTGAPGAPGAPGGSGIQKVTSFPVAPADGDTIIRTDLSGSPLFVYSPENGWEQSPRMGAVTIPSVRAYASAAPTALPHNTFVAATFNSEEFDTDSIHDTVTNNTRLTIKTPGLYLLRGFFSWLPSSSGSRWIQFNKNGTLIPGARQIQMPSGSAALRMSLSTTVRLVAGDYIELMSLQDSGGPLDSVDSPYIEATWLGGPGQTVDERGVPAFSANNLANQSIPGANVATKLAFPSVAYDTDNCFDTTNSRFVVKTPGLWNLSMLLPLEDNSSQWLVRLYKNGARYRDLSAVDASTALTASPYFTINTQVLAAAGDYFELFMFNNPAGAFNVFGGATEYGRAIFSGSLVGSSKIVTPFARSYMSSLSVPNNVDTAVPFDLEASDNDAIHDTVSNNTRLVAKTAGVYAIVSSLTWGGSTGGQRRSILRKNGTYEISRDTRSSGSIANPATVVVGVVELAIGDYVEVIAYQDSGAAVALLGGTDGGQGVANVSVVKVGAPSAGSSGAEAIEGWHVVGAAGEPAFQNGWTSTGTGGQLRFKKDRGVTYIQSIAGVSGSAALVFTLPPGYRPGNMVRSFQQQNASSTPVQVSVDIDGTVTTSVTKPSGGWVAFDMSFRND